MSTEVIKEFLVALGFKLDEAAMRKWDSTLGKATADVTAFATAVTASAVAITTAVAKISDEFEKLYFSSKRVGASVENIQAFGYAASQMGGTVEGARGALEGLARAMRNNPGIAGFLGGQLGIETRGRDLTQVFGDLATRFKQMPYYLSRAYAEMLGIDEQTLMAMIAGLDEFGDEYHRVSSMAAVDAQTAAQSSREFMIALRRLGSTFDVLARVIMTRMKPVATFIVDAVARSIEGILWLDRVTQGWSTTIGTTLVGALTGALVAWKLLNLGFMASPLGIVITLVLALAAAVALLYDDYKAWEDGGQSLINWGEWKSEIESAVAGIKWLGEKIDWLYKKAKALFDLISPGGGKDFTEQLVNPTPSDSDALINPSGADPVGDTARWLGRKLGIVSDSSKPDNKAALDQRAMADQALKFFQSKGWSRENSAGLVSNIQHESAFNPQAKGDGGRALGIAQWHPDRQADFKAFAGKDIRDSSFEDQLAFMHHELTAGKERRAGEALARATTAQESGAVVSSQYERPADRIGEAMKRGGTAAEIFNRTPLAPAGTDVASAAPGPAAGVTLNQTNNVSVSGVPPEQVAAQVETSIDRSNNSAVRDLQGVVR